MARLVMHEDDRNCRDLRRLVPFQLCEALARDVIPGKRKPRRGDGCRDVVVVRRTPISIWAYEIDSSDADVSSESPQGHISAT